MIRNLRNRLRAARGERFPAKTRHGGKQATSPKGLAFEPLEPRLVLNGQSLLITEFLASNEDVLYDEDGQNEDWIEIYNPTDAAVDLDGWYLTDNRDDLDKWQFPAVTIGGGDYRVVFASDKNRRDPDGELHTNFKLDPDGEYLALVMPDGETVVHDYAPEFPEQVRNSSYGLTQEVTTLILEGTPVSYLVPSSAADATDTSGTPWTEPGFDDSAWASRLLDKPVRVTEIDAGQPDRFEIQNLGNYPVDTSGWVVAVHDGSNQNINDMIKDKYTGETILLELPGTMEIGEVLYATEDRQDEFYLGSIWWQETGGAWVMIVDDEGQVVDFAVYGYSEADIASLNINVNGFDITIGDAWTGDGHDARPDDDPAGRPGPRASFGARGTAPGAGHPAPWTRTWTR